jgi:hypothetical protein
MIVMILGTITFLMEKAVEPSKINRFLMEKWISKGLPFKFRLAQ